MIRMLPMSVNTMKVVPTGTLKTEDFNQLAPQLNDLLKQHKKIKLLVDATDFTGWDDMKAFEAHINFAKKHQQRVEKIAIVTGHNWQIWLAAMVRLFVHPEVQLFEKEDEAKALHWLEDIKQAA